MRIRGVYLFLILAGILFSGCTKEKEQRYFGIDTIDNQLYEQTIDKQLVYYAIGFSFDEGKTLPLPSREQSQPDMTVHALTDNAGIVTGAYLDTPILIPPFFLAGEFITTAEAVTFYKNLLEVNSPVWLPSANPVYVNQVLIVRTLKGNYAKFRVIEFVFENRPDGPFVEMKFEWRVQPDGSTSFLQ